MTATREAAIAKMKARAAQQPTATLCEAVVMLAGRPRTPETNLTRAVMTDVLCERHPEAEAAAEAWAESDDETDYDAVVVGAALTAIGA
jgi:hypothetical protein